MAKSTQILQTIQPTATSYDEGIGAVGDTPHSLNLIPSCYSSGFINTDVTRETLDKELTADTWQEKEVQKRRKGKGSNTLFSLNHTKVILLGK